MTFLFLERVKAFLESEVCTRISLKRPSAEDAMHFELVPPVVSIGWPEVELGSAAVRQRVPGIAVGIREPVTDDGESRTVPIQLALIVYSTGTLLAPENLEVDGTGYWDLLNLMDRTVRAVINAESIGGMVLSPKGVQYLPDSEPLQDYWLGVVEFDLEGPPAPRTAERELN